MKKDNCRIECSKSITEPKLQTILSSHGAVPGSGHYNESIRGMVIGSTCMTRVLQPAYTVRLRPDPDERRPDEAASCAGNLRNLSWHGITARGMVRDHNEDSLAFLSLGDKSLFVIADGMGGHDAGEIASKLAVDTVCSEVRAGMQQSEGYISLLEHSIRMANDRVRQEGTRRGSNMGTTLSVALVADSTAYIGNVGDSRVYWIENESITQITEDHSLVAKLIAAGRLTSEEARNHPRSNILYRSIGTDEVVNVDTFCVPLSKGGSLLLCTDGLWGALTDANINRICTGDKDIKAVGSMLVQIANENGGRDNITAVVVKIE